MVRAMDLSSSPSPTPTKTTNTTPDTDSQTEPPPPPLLLPHPIKSLSFTINGSLNRHQPQPPRPPTTQPIVVSYRECLKNHAASIGGHALDGCGEFMPSPSALPSDPTSLKCAACGCHRNFHRRHPDKPPCHHLTPASFHNNQHGRLHHLLLPSPPFLPPPRRNSSPSPSLSPGRSSSPGLTPSPTPSPHSPPPVSHLPPNSYLASPPQMLLALSSGLSRPSDYQFQNFDPTAPKSVTENNGNNNNARKRFRTKFSQEQKEKMCLFAEKVGWKMLRSEEKVVEEFCNEVGVRRGVLKVWMHNNKHTLGKKSSINLRINNGINDDHDHNAATNHDTDHDQKDDQDHHRKANFNFFAYGSSSSS